MSETFFISQGEKNEKPKDCSSKEWKTIGKES